MPPQRKTTAREYLRVSHDASGRLRSAEEQHDDNQRAADSSGWKLAEPYTEPGAVSASRYAKKARGTFAELVADLEAGRFRADVLILWESSRGSRRLSEWARFLEQLEEHGVLLHVTSHGRTYDLSNPRDRRALQEDGVDAEAESGKISVRVRRAMAANAAAGRAHGRIAYGYRREYATLAGGRQIMTAQLIDEERAPVVRDVFARLSRGESLRAVAAALTAAGIKTPAGGAKWAPQQVRQLALKPVYAARRVYQGEELPGDWPEIVDAELYWTVYDLLTNPERRSSRPGNEKHLLSMIAECAVCDGILSVRYRPDARYWCRGAGHVMMPEQLLDEYVSRLAVARLGRPDAYGQLDDGSDPGQLGEARGDLAALRARHAEITAAMAAGDMSVTAFTTAEPRVLAAIADAERLVARLAAPSALRFLLGEPDGDVAERWARAPLAARREIVRTLFARISVGRLEAGADPLDRVTIEWRGDAAAADDTPTRK